MTPAQRIEAYKNTYVRQDHPVQMTPEMWERFFDELFAWDSQDHISSMHKSMSMPVPADAMFASNH